MITIKHFNLLLKIMKAMKCDRYILLPDRIIGSDKDLITLTEAFTATNIEVPYIELTKDMFKVITDSIEYVSTKKTKEELETVTLDKFLYQISIKRIADVDILVNYNNVTNEIYNAPNITVESFEDMKSDDEFSEYLNLKAAQGQRIYHLENGDTITLFAGLLPVNKRDKVDIFVYRVATNTFISNNIYICKYIIDKGFVKINKYIKHIGLD